MSEAEEEEGKNIEGKRKKALDFASMCFVALMLAVSILIAFSSSFSWFYFLLWFLFALGWGCSSFFASSLPEILREANPGQDNHHHHRNHQQQQQQQQDTVSTAASAVKK